MEIQKAAVGDIPCEYAQMKTSFKRLFGAPSVFSGMLSDVLGDFGFRKHFVGTSLLLLEDRRSLSISSLLHMTVQMSVASNLENNQRS